MAASPKRICWDACAWIALIQKERIALKHGVPGTRYSACRSVIDLAQSQRKIDIVVSGLCLAEVCKIPDVIDAPPDEIARYFDGDHILIVPVDRQVGSLAREVIRTQALRKKADHSLHIPKPQDAIHLATSLVANVDELNTFDDNLLGLTEALIKTDGTTLRICQPSDSGPPMPLLANSRP